MTDLRIFKKIWSFHLRRRSEDGFSLEKNSLLSEIGKANLKPLNRNLDQVKNDSPRNVLIIYASERLVPLHTMKEAVHNFQGIENKSTLNPIFVDVSARKFLPSQMKVLALKSLLYVDFKSILDVIRKGYISLLANCVANWSSRNKIDLICLFTSNSRLVEFYRLCAIKENIQHVEFLHGTCSDSFSEYYDLLEAYSFKKNIKNYYVNLCPGLPQPLSVKNSLLHYDNKEVYFRNERMWENPSKISYDALIVGGNSPQGNYVETNFFDNEILSIKSLLENNLSVVYCPHPRNVNYINKDMLPKGVTISKLYNVINSSKVIIGGYSATLFISHLLGKNVLLYSDFWNLLPAELISLFNDRKQHTFSIERVLELNDPNNDNEKIRHIKTTNSIDIMNLYNNSEG